MLDLLPTAAVHHIGMYKSKNDSMPVQYYNRLPKNESCDIAYLLDPCIATAKTLAVVVSMLKKWGAKQVVVISAVASKEGIKHLSDKHPDISIYVGAIDETLNEHNMIVPGIGDAGDRQFKTPLDITEEELAKKQKN